MPAKPPVVKGGAEYDGNFLTTRELLNLVKARDRELKVYENKYQCSVCGKFKAASDYYKYEGSIYKDGVPPICKECTHDILYRKDEIGKLHEPTKDSLIMALLYLNKPFYNDLYQKCLDDSESKTSKRDFGKSYLSKITRPKYNGQTFYNSDMLKASKAIKEFSRLSEEEQEQLNQDITDTIDILGFDPFEEEAEGDKRFLYATFLSLADTGTNEEGNKMRAQSCVPIVRNFLQVQKMDDRIQDILAHPHDPVKDIQLINKYSETKSTLQSSIVRLAETNLISEKNNKSQTKGQGSWTNKLKKLKSLQFRAAENNRFSIMTCQGMQQVADISAQSILKAIKLQDNEYSEMLADQTKKIIELQEDLDFTNEAMRILLRENFDLKELLHTNGIDIGDNLVNLTNLLYSSDEGDDEDAKVDS